MRQGFRRYLMMRVALSGASGLGAVPARPHEETGLAAVGVAFVVLPAGASGAVTGVLAGHTMNGQPIPCVAQSDGVRMCHGDESGSAQPISA